MTTEQQIQQHAPDDLALLNFLEKEGIEGNVEIARAWKAACEYKDEWISVEERLPEERVRVLALPKGYPFYLIREADWEEYTNKNKEWFKEIFTHWMPLPSLPQPPKTK